MERGWESTKTGGHKGRRVQGQKGTRTRGWECKRVQMQEGKSLGGCKVRGKRARGHNPEMFLPITY